MINPTGGYRPNIPAPTPEPAQAAPAPKQAETVSVAQEPEASPPDEKIKLPTDGKREQRAEESLGRNRIEQAKHQASVTQDLARTVDEMTSTLKSRSGETSDTSYARFRQALDNSAEISRQIPQNASPQELTELRDAFYRLQNELENQLPSDPISVDILARNHVKGIVEKLDKRIEALGGSSPAPELRTLKNDLPQDDRDLKIKIRPQDGDGQEFYTPGDGKDVNVDPSKKFQVDIFYTVKREGMTDLRNTASGTWTPSKTPDVQSLSELTKHMYPKLF